MGICFTNNSEILDTKYIHVFVMEQVFLPMIFSFVSIYICACKLCIVNAISSSTVCAMRKGAKNLCKDVRIASFSDSYDSQTRN